MKRLTRVTSLTIVGLTFWVVLWRAGRNTSTWNELNSKSNEFDRFLPHFRQIDTVDEALEAHLYESLSSLSQSFNFDTGKEWPKFIWQTSPSKEVTQEMNSWKIRNPEWKYQVGFFYFYFLFFYTLAH